jgi:hypothetical protein
MGYELQRRAANSGVKSITGDRSGKHSAFFLKFSIFRKTLSNWLDKNLLIRVSTHPPWLPKASNPPVVPAEIKVAATKGTASRRKVGTRVLMETLFDKSFVITTANYTTKNTPRVTLLPSS